MKPRRHAVLLLPETPPSLLAMLKNYVHSYDDGIKMLFASSVSYDQFGFVEMAILGKSKSDTLRISLPSSCVLAIADSRDKSGNEEKLGFAP